MINRTYQLLDYLSKNVQSEYSNFKEKNFDIANMNNRCDIKILSGLIQSNNTIGSWVAGINLVKEELEYRKNNETTFRINPEHEDNNNGILVIDIQEDGTIKYGLSGGYEEIENFKHFKMINASEYFKLSEKYKTGEYEKYKLVNQDKDLYDKVMKQIQFIDKFKLLTQKEYEDIFNKDYMYKDCMEEFNNE